jgi:large subunit ribosomal protein L21
MYAILNVNGIQARAEKDQVLELPRMKGEPGDQVKLSDVMLVGDGDKITVGQPFLKGAAVTIEVLEHFRGPKLRIFKFKRRRAYRRRIGYRDECTRVRVASITV